MAPPSPSPPRSKLSVAFGFYRSQRPRIVGTLSVVIGLGLTTYIGVVGTSTTPPTGDELAAVLFLAAIFQILGGASFGRVGYVNEQKAKSAVRSLVVIGNQIAGLSSDLRLGLALGDETLRSRAEVAAAQLQLIGVLVENSVQDWNDVHPEALIEVLAGHQAITTLGETHND